MQRSLVGGVGGAALLGAALVLLRGRSLRRALARRPALFPEVARAVNQIRHDVLKHRTSVIGLLVAGAAPREEVARVLWEPERTSSLVAAAYRKLQGAALERGVALRPLAREPALGPLVRDLRRAEALVRGRGGLEPLRAVDERLRNLHPERLAALLRLGPRTRLDPALLSRWMAEVEGEVRLRGDGWTAPALHLEGGAPEFPVEAAALATIFTNLLRNAEAAVADAPGERRVIVRVQEERDPTGRRNLALLVGDSSPRALTMEAIEGRESGRGLAIVRDLVHEWRGQLAIRAEPPPFEKAVGACFPAT
jgi:signal transduction histidine kinase